MIIYKVGIYHSLYSYWQLWYLRVVNVNDIMCDMKTNQSVEEIIWAYGKDIIMSPKMQTEKAFMQHKKVNCFDHSVFVAYMSVRISGRLKTKVDMRSLVRGALLHDYFLYDWHIPDKSHRLHGFYHAKKALNNAQRDYELNAIEEDIIATHMFPLNPGLPQYKESLIVNFADKVCAAFELLSISFPIPVPVHTKE